MYWRNPPEVFLGKFALNIWSKFRGEHSCQSVILIKLLCNLIEIKLWHECSLVNLLHIFQNSFSEEHHSKTAFVSSTQSYSKVEVFILLYLLLKNQQVCLFGIEIPFTILLGSTLYQDTFILWQSWLQVWKHHQTFA